MISYIQRFLKKMNKMDILNTVKTDIENESSHENESDSDNDETDKNIIIENFSIGGDKRVDVSSMLSTILAQRELDQKRFLLLSKKNGDLEVENSKLDTKLHYMKLDLANAEIRFEKSQAEKKRMINSLKDLETNNKTLNVHRIVLFIVWLITIVIECFFYASRVN